MSKVKVGVAGYGVIGLRLATGVAMQEDMELVGVSDVAPTLAVRGLVEIGCRRVILRQLTAQLVRIAAVLQSFVIHVQGADGLAGDGKHAILARDELEVHRLVGIHYLGLQYYHKFNWCACFNLLLQEGFNIIRTSRV